VRVAVASGPAFSFVYRENLELLRGAGAEIVFFDPTTEEDLPEGTDALYLGGGFPETYAEALSENEALRDKVRAFALSGRPVAAECGGLLYLCRELDGKRMCGVLDASARMTNRLSLGYREARSLADSPLTGGAIPCAVMSSTTRPSNHKPGPRRTRHRPGAFGAREGRFRRRWRTRELFAHPLGLHPASATPLRTQRRTEQDRVVRRETLYWSTGMSGKLIGVGVGPGDPSC
jgi:hypothetical protein